ncbi:MAG TPA: ribbon-helix-helix protein, CopG family [Candidatus Pacearchaeota archaeon]|nr:ribbon-helix-helix protein, CopG family [Candidatus Pacearchaeota archaeon]
MKTKISVSLEDELHEKLKKIVKRSIFRNKSHLIEHAIESLLKEEGIK